ncbi:sirohydrochlorin chelatase [Microlunatus ginsengisoli]|uniref:Sirohydrochlorin chelatase n=1 Tax=Microlunatus ginsengisoli TaxID=363863 RepID=A0ABP6ZQ07_9ACTN
MTRTAIVGLAHGSRHPGVRGPIDDLMAATAELAGAPARAAYLDLTEPGLDTVVGELVADGIERAAIVPLLFTNAFHARTDVPATVAAAGADRGCDLVTADILGTGDDVLSVVESIVDEAGIAADLPVLLYAVGSSDDSANAAVEAFAHRLGGRRGTAARAAFGTTDPRPQTVLPELVSDAPEGGVVALVPLFVSPGLLLDPLACLARDRGYPLTPPLGHRLAPVVAARATAALG